MSESQRPAGDSKLVTAPDVVVDATADAGAVVTETVLTNSEYELEPPSLYAVLHLAREPVDRTEFVDRVAAELGVEESTATELVATLEENGIVVPPETADRPEWSGQSWETALDYLQYIRDYPFIDDVIEDDGMDSQVEYDQQLMEEYADTESPPPVYLDETGEQVSLPDPGTVDISLLDTVTGTAPTAVELDRERLSTLLKLVFGETGRIDFGVQGEFLLKTSPSGGARHPTEAYLSVHDVSGLDAGVYHYNVRDHELTRLPESSTSFADLAGYELPLDRPSVVVWYASVLPRSMWRYRESRTYRVVHHDVGHLVESLRIACRALGLQTHTDVRFDADRVTETLDLDPAERPVLAYTAVR